EDYSLDTIYDHTELKNVDTAMIEHMNNWRLYYGGKNESVSYVTANGLRTRPKKSLRMSKIVSNQMASLIFNERCQININDEDTHKYIREVLSDSKFYSVFQNYLEYMFALGGLVIKPYFDF